jgi:methylase of polypeptide subunit release factors
VNFYNKLSQDLGFASKVDLILCNPPWIPASPVSCSLNPLENAVYDDREKFLISSLNFAKFHLHPEKGEMLLIYSDLAQNLGI